MRKSLKVFGSMLACTMIAMSMGAKGGGTVAIGDNAPAFSLADANGKNVSLGDYKGKTVVLEWFNATCPVVVGHYDKKTMTTLASKYKDKDVVWLAVDWKGDQSGDKKFIDKYGVTYPVLLDQQKNTTHAYGATNTPHMFIVDKEGKLAYKGAIDDQKKDGSNYVDAALGELLAGKPVSKSETKAYGCGIH